jgi:hypothetical protein
MLFLVATVLVVGAASKRGVLCDHSAPIAVLRDHNCSLDNSRILANARPLQEHYSASSSNDDLMPDLWVRGAASFLPALSGLIQYGSGLSAEASLRWRSMATFRAEADADTVSLKNALDKWHSDKADVVHNFHFVYGDIFRKLGRTNSLRTLEIGMGTNNPHLPSTMGKRGSPGASLRAFRDFLPRAAVHGGDIDRAILFQEDRIRTGFVDQLDLPTLDTLYTAMGSEPFDLIIDDGLHALGANANTLLFALRSVRPGGFVVIEDVTVRCLPGIALIDALLRSTSPKIEAYLVKTGSIKEWGSRSSSLFMYVLRVPAK